MAYCIHCGAQIIDDAAFCTSCGKEQVVRDVPQPSAQTAQPAQQFTPGQPVPPVMPQQPVQQAPQPVKKHTARNAIIITVSVLCLLAAAGALFYFFVYRTGRLSGLIAGNTASEVSTEQQEEKETERRSRREEAAERAEAEASASSSAEASTAAEEASTADAADTASSDDAPAQPEVPSFTIPQMKGEEVDVATLPDELTRFVEYLAFFEGDIYEADGKTVTYSSPHLIYNVMKYMPCVDLTIYPGLNLLPESHDLTKENDPKNLFNTWIEHDAGKYWGDNYPDYVRYAASDIDWVMKNIFNCTDAYIKQMREQQKMYQTAFPYSPVYYHENYYYRANPGAHGSLLGTRIVSATNDGTYYYVLFRTGDFYSTPEEVKALCFAKLQEKEIGGSRYWSLYSYRVINRDGSENVTQLITLTGENVHVRADASTTAESLGLLKKGSTFLVKGSKKDNTGTDWYLVDYGWTSGYIRSDLAKVLTW